MKPRILEVRANVLKKNDEVARALRGRFADNGVYVVNVVSGPGAGKTELLTKVMRELSKEFSVAAVVGDLATENDADRLAESGCPSRQILTETMCHMEAQMVERAVEPFDLPATDLIFIENIGNLVCPQGFDLGEDLRVLLFATTEGEDKPLKYPTLINTCDLVLFSKMDIAEPVGFDAELARKNTDAGRPGVPIIETSAKTGLGVDTFVGHLRTKMLEKRAHAESGARV